MKRSHSGCSDPSFDSSGRIIICRGCGWNADGGTCAHCGTVAPERDRDVQAWREVWGVVHRRSGLDAA